MTIKKLLIANRGEIALRIMRSCQELGIKTVAIYSKCDAEALHVLAADEAYLIGESPAKESYLNGKKIVEIAKHSGAEAIHPGYGFLAENAEFAKLVANAKLLFVGPSAQAIDAMGDKLNARKLAAAAKVPVIPGSPPLNSDTDASKWAKKIALPLLIKCCAGGGGHGMRIVRELDELESAFRQTRAEGKKAFADDTVYMEKLLQKPKHVEVQVFGLASGQVVHLFSRGCSVQRRYQKVIEEAPAPSIPQATLKDMQQAAIKLSEKIGYQGAGTVEFLVDAENNFYFLEMNTRLQVEHTVTEMVLGIDLVALQILQAQNHELASPIIDKLREADNKVMPRGHAIQCRIYAESPEHNFAPTPGSLPYVRFPQGPWTRVDSGIQSGSVVPIYYDPMIAKIITWGENREACIRRLSRALDETILVGTHTNLNFLKQLIKTARFKKGDYDTHIIAKESANITQPPLNDDETACIETAAALANLDNQQKQSTPRTLSPWQQSFRRSKTA